MTDYLTGKTEALLVKAARRLESLRRRGKIRQKVAGMRNSFITKLFCGRCFGVVLHEMLHDRRHSPRTFDYNVGAGLLDKFLKEGGHYRKYARLGYTYNGHPCVTEKVAAYLNDFCGAPVDCFGADDWPTRFNQAAVIMTAVELNKKRKKGIRRKSL